ncbi:MAG: M48 family metallopeptidase [Spirochaetes bacterium]|nr:M48 family metallopeptidase [Spirochaetota bacterium]
MNPYLIFILAVIIITYILELVVEILNIRNISPELPSEFRDVYDNERYGKSQLYLKDNTKTGIINKTFFTLISVIFILAGGFNYIDLTARGFGFCPVFTGLIFTGILVLLMQIIELPFSIYDTFVIEERYGFNKTTPKTFVLDLVKGLLLGAVIGGLLYACILWFFGRFETWAWLYAWIALTVFQLLLNFIAPVVIMPVFNKFIPLEDGELKQSIQDYADSQGFKMKGVFKMDGSKRSTKSNAYFTGFGKFRRIVLFDTLIEKHSVAELVSVLAHEMGHYKKKHIFKSFLISILTTGLMFFVLSLFINNPALFDAFKMDHVSIYASLLFFGFLYAPILEIISILTNYLSRKHEYEADAYSVETGNDPEAMISALKKLSVDNLSNLNPHPVMVFLKYSHPPVLKRIEHIRSLASGR